MSGPSSSAAQFKLCVGEGLAFLLNSENFSNPQATPTTNNKQQMSLHLQQMIRHSKPPMIIHRSDELTIFAQPAVLGTLIGVSIILVLGLIVAMIQACSSSWGQEIGVWRHMMDHLRQTSGENPHKSMHLPIQTPPPPSPPPSSPIPIPA